MDKAVVVLVTAPGEELARKLAVDLVEKKLAACANMLPVHSVYTWKGKVEDQKEVMLVIKTREARLDALMARVREMHPYEVPEIVALPMAGGNADYLSWILENTGD